MEPTYNDDYSRGYRAGQFDREHGNTKDDHSDNPSFDAGYRAGFAGVSPAPETDKHGPWFDGFEEE